MLTPTLKAETRDRVGKGGAHSLRRQGLVPAIVYGRALDPQPVAVKSTELERLLTSISWENTLIDLQIDHGAPAKALIREVQFHPFKPEVLHVDFMQIRAGEKVEVEVPVRIVGAAPGVKAGGVLELALHSVRLRCDPARIPEAVEVDVSALEIGDSLHVSDLRVTDAEVLTEETTTIAVVVPPTVQKVEEVVAAPAEEVEPEVVGRGKKEEEAAEAGEEEEEEEEEEE
ncbi:MAG: 50S ribosomal protein L25/general stress protein Ctc [Gemmatimonadetes bacterium]|nr:50S ribosomal protein L25/general stress protein Ctc [Gemmatimonadota bacterium]